MTTHPKAALVDPPVPHCPHCGKLSTAVVGNAFVGVPKCDGRCTAPPAASRAARPADGREAVPEDVRASLLAVAEYAEAHRGPYEELYDDAATLRAIAAGTHPAVALVDRARLAQLEADAARLDWIEKNSFGFTSSLYPLNAPHQRWEVEANDEDGSFGFGETVRNAIDAARSARAAEGDHA